MKVTLSTSSTKRTLLGRLLIKLGQATELGPNQIHYFQTELPNGTEVFVSGRVPSDVVDPEPEDFTELLVTTNPDGLIREVYTYDNQSFSDEMSSDLLEHLSKLD